MKEYNNPDEYIADVKSHIKWKRAKSVATKELYDHICDQYDALIASGCSETEAMNRAIREMGSADVVGTDLDLAHRPKTNWLLICTTLIFVIIGLLIDYRIYEHIGVEKKLSAVAIGVLCAFVIYWFDYTGLIRIPRISYAVLTLITFSALLYDLRNGADNVEYFYSYYLMILFPIVQIGINFHLKRIKAKLGMFYLLLYSLPPIFAAFYISSPTAIIVLLLVDIMLFVYALKNKYFSVNVPSVLLSVLAITVFIILLWSLGLPHLISEKILAQKELAETTYIRELIYDLPFVGETTVDDYKADKFIRPFPITWLAIKFGKIMYFIVGLVFASFIYALYRVSERQNTIFGKLISFMISIIFTVQVVFCFLSSMGIVGGALTMCLPFVASGGSFTIYNLILVGIILSVSRNEAIAKDWIKIKSKEMNITSCEL